MYLSTLKLWNFRKYGIEGDQFDTAKPGLTLELNEKVNVLIGENDSGKTTIIDAIRYILRTQSGEFIRIDEKDFHQNGSNGIRAEELKIECVFRGFTDAEAGSFLEWLGFEPSEDEGQSEYFLRIWLYARIKDDNTVYQYVRAGVNSEGSYIEGEARELLKVVYLKPLRDALSEMTHGNKSRFAQILKAHSVFRRKKDATGTRELHPLETEYDDMKKDIDDYFSLDDKAGKEIATSINNLLAEEFFTHGDERRAEIKLTGNDLSDILRQLDLNLEHNKSGLGSLNLLCIAAELLLFLDVDNNNKRLKLTLIEELEAHLHPQYQLRLIDFLTNKAKGQFLLTTHSTTLASKIPLKQLILCKDGDVYPMGPKYTHLNESDYAFLERFLDATKANLFFAKGVIIVEGDAENLLIPTIASIIERPLHKHGVSIVNVGSTAFKRYAKIFERKDNKTLSIPVSVVSDLDVRALESYHPDKIPEVVIVDDEFVTKIKNITDCVDCNNIPAYFLSEAHFLKYISFSKTKRFPRVKSGQLSVSNQLKELYNGCTSTKITNEILEQIRQKRIEKSRTLFVSDKIKIFLPEKWTLEYEFSCSELRNALLQAIEVAKIEILQPDLKLQDSVFNTAREIADKKMKDQPINPILFYFIYKPLCNGSVSKASAAQYFAEILSQNNEKDIRDGIVETDTVKYTLCNDQYLQYIYKAIIHVTGGTDDE